MATFTVFKSNGEYRWIASHTNSFIDLQKEIITSAAHREYLDAVKDGFPKPILVLCHNLKWKIGYTDLLAIDEISPGIVFVIASGGFSPGLDDVAERLTRIESKMSHGLLALETGEFNGASTIDKYRDIEISVLPNGVDNPANPLTYYVVEEPMSIDDDVRRNLLKNVIGEDLVARIESANEGLASKALDEGLVYKTVTNDGDPVATDSEEAHSADTGDEVVTSVEAEVAVVDATAANTPVHVTIDDFNALAELIGQVAKTINDAIGVTNSAVVSLNERLKALEDDSQTRLKGLEVSMVDLGKQVDKPIAVSNAYAQLLGVMQKSILPQEQTSSPAKENKTADAVTRQSVANSPIGYLKAITEN